MYFHLAILWPIVTKKPCTGSVNKICLYFYKKGLILRAWNYVQETSI